MPKPTTPPIKRNREYDPFADIYNRFWGTEYRRDGLPVLERLLLSRLKPGQAVLDVCCGTGQFADEICAQGYAVTGVDASAAMIRHARRNAPNAEFVVADVRDFSLERKFHAAYSVFDSFNHIPDADGLEQAFRRVRSHLRRGAPFLFDLVGRATYRNSWNTTHAIVEKDVVCSIRLTFEESTGSATCDITVLSNPPAWQRRDFTVRQTCHEFATVESRLSAAGFKDLTLLSARDLGMSPSLGRDRTFYLVTA